MLKLDHLVYAVENLEIGQYDLESCLGVPFEKGGRHEKFSTHNSLLKLDEVYFELIATDPLAPNPSEGRWFNLDNFSGPSRLITWVCRTDDMKADLNRIPFDVGSPVCLSRGDLRWALTIPTNLGLTMGGCFPSLIEWEGQCSPIDSLPCRNCHLIKLIIRHPKSNVLKASLCCLFEDARVQFEYSEEIEISVVLRTPNGIVEL